DAPRSEVACVLQLRGVTAAPRHIGVTLTDRGTRKLRSSRRRATRLRPTTVLQVLAGLPSRTTQNDAWAVGNAAPSQMSGKCHKTSTRSDSPQSWARPGRRPCCPKVNDHHRARARARVLGLPRSREPW